MSSPQPNPKSPTNEIESQDVNMDVPDSPPAGFSSPVIASSSTQANTSGRVNGEGNGRPGSGGGGGSNNTKPSFGAPGSSWSTKKFSEEYEKAEANMLDRGWENKYGDPLLTLQQQQQPPSQQ